MAQDHWSPGADIIYIGIIVGVVNFRTSGPGNEDWLTANRLECPDRAVNTTRDHLFCLGKKIGRFLVIHSGSLKNLLALESLTASTGLGLVDADPIGLCPRCRIDVSERMAWLLLYIKLTPVNIATRACQENARFHVGSTVGLVQFLIF